MLSLSSRNSDDYSDTDDSSDSENDENDKLDNMSYKERKEEVELKAFMRQLLKSSNTQKSFDDYSKSLKTAIVERNFSLDTEEKDDLRRVTSSIRNFLNPTSIPAIVEKLEVICNDLGIKLVPGPSGYDFFVSSEMFYIEIILGVTCVQQVKIHHDGSNQQEVCDTLLESLENHDFKDVILHLRGLIDLYNIGTEKSVKSQAFSSLRLLEFDIRNANDFLTQRNAIKARNLVFRSPFGRVVDRNGGHPMKLIYLPAICDLISSLDETDSRPPGPALEDTQYSLQILTKGLSYDVTLPTRSLIDVAASNEQGKPVFCEFNDDNCAMVPACFTLKFGNKIAASEGVIKDIHKLTSLDVITEGPITPILHLIYKDVLKKTIDTEDVTTTISLGDQDHKYVFSKYTDEGFLVTAIPFTHPHHVLRIIEIVRSVALMNILIASCVRVDSQDTDGVVGENKSKRSKMAEETNEDSDSESFEPISLDYDDVTQENDEQSTASVFETRAKREKDTISDCNITMSIFGCNTNKEIYDMLTGEYSSDGESIVSDDVVEERCLVIDVTPVNSTKLSVSFEHPRDDSLVSMIFDLSDVGSITCVAKTNKGKNTPDFDNAVKRATFILQRTFSIPMAVRVFVQLWDGCDHSNNQLGEKYYEEVIHSDDIFNPSTFWILDEEEGSPKLKENSRSASTRGKLELNAFRSSNPYDLAAAGLDFNLDAAINYENSKQAAFVEEKPRSVEELASFWKNPSERLEEILRNTLEESLKELPKSNASQTLNEISNSVLAKLEPVEQQTVPAARSSSSSSSSTDSDSDSSSDSSDSSCSKRDREAKSKTQHSGIEVANASSPSSHSEIENRKEARKSDIQNLDAAISDAKNSDVSKIRVGNSENSKEITNSEKGGPESDTRNTDDKTHSLLDFVEDYENYDMKDIENFLTIPDDQLPKATNNTNANSTSLCPLDFDDIPIITPPVVLPPSITLTPMTSASVSTLPDSSNDSNASSSTSKGSLTITPIRIRKDSINDFHSKSESKSSRDINEERNRSERKKKRKRNSSPMGPPEKTYKYDNKQSVSITIKQVECSSTPSSPKKYVVSSPTYASASKSSPKKMTSPKHTISSSGKPNMSALKSSVISPSSSKHKDVSKKRRSSTSSNESGKAKHSAIKVIKIDSSSDHPSNVASDTQPSTSEAKYSNMKNKSRLSLVVDKLLHKHNVDSGDDAKASFSSSRESKSSSSTDYKHSLSQSKGPAEYMVKPSSDAMKITINKTRTKDDSKDPRPRICPSLEEASKHSKFSVQAKKPSKKIASNLHATSSHAKSHLYREPIGASKSKSSHSDLYRKEKTRKTEEKQKSTTKGSSTSKEDTHRSLIAGAIVKPLDTNFQIPKLSQRASSQSDTDSKMDSGTKKHELFESAERKAERASIMNYGLNSIPVVNLQDVNYSPFLYQASEKVKSASSHLKKKPDDYSFQSHDPRHSDNLSQPHNNLFRNQSSLESSKSKNVGSEMKKGGGDLSEDHKSIKSFANRSKEMSNYEMIASSHGKNADENKRLDMLDPRLMLPSLSVPSINSANLAAAGGKRIKRKVGNQILHPASK